MQKSYLSLPQKNRSVRRKHFLLTLLFSFGPYCLTVPLHFASLWGVAVLVAAFCYALDGDLVVVLMRGSPSDAAALPFRCYMSLTVKNTAWMNTQPTRANSRYRPAVTPRARARAMVRAVTPQVIQVMT